MPQFETLVDDIEKLFLGKDISERIHHLTEKLGTTFVDRFLEYAEERQPKVSMSNLGWPLRKLWYHVKGFKGEPLSFETKLKFMYGSMIEDLVLFLAAEAGHEVTDLQSVVEVDGIRGKTDAKIDGVLCDIKSCSTRSFEKFEKGTILTDDPFGYIAQLNGYKQGVKAERAAFIAIDKTLGKICVYNLPDTHYDLGLRIQTVRKVLEKDVPPERCYEPKKVSKTDKTGNLILSAGCAYCQFKTECWKDCNDGTGLQLRHYSSGPKFFTTLLKEPRLKYDEEYTPFPIKEN